MATIPFSEAAGRSAVESCYDGSISPISKYMTGRIILARPISQALAVYKLIRHPSSSDTSFDSF